MRAGGDISHPEVSMHFTPMKPVRKYFQAYTNQYSLDWVPMPFAARLLKPEAGGT